MRIVLTLLCLFNLCFAQLSYQPSPTNLQARKDFQDAKFGMFIHWGIYSLMADGEWVMYTRKIPYAQYTKLAQNFNPIHFDADAWVQLAKQAGMKYITITSRHHDGFSMFDTKASNYNIVQATPYKRDPLKELAAACKKHGLKLNFYYSLLDWGRKDYGFGKRIVNGQPEQTDWNSYINFMKQQLTELLTNYGEIGAIWFDGHWERKTADWHTQELYDLIHRLQPACLVGNNHHITPLEGEDYQMFEKDLPGKMSHYSFRGGFNSWQTLSNKNIDHAEFRKFTDHRLAEIEDSIRKAQAGHIFVTHKLIQEMPSIEYDSLKENIFKLPTAWNSSSRYFGKALNELSKQRPELYFRMAEDFPEHRQLIFASVEDNKHVIETLKAVEGYSEVKKQFFKERRFNKSMPYKLVATTAVTIGLIVYLIAK